MKFGQVIEYNKKNIFFKNHADNKAGRLVPDLLLFESTSCEVKPSGLQLSLKML